MWNNWAQNQNKSHTIIVDSEKEFYEPLTCPGTEVTNLIFPNDDVAWVSWKYSEDNVVAGKKANVALSAYVTTQRRLKLYEYLSKLREPALYCDTDPVIFIQKHNDPPNVKTGDYLGDVIGELEEYGSWSFLLEFVSGVPKNYAFFGILASTGKRAAKCKEKGITLNYEFLKL